MIDEVGNAFAIALGLCWLVAIGIGIYRDVVRGDWSDLR